MTRSSTHLTTVVGIGLVLQIRGAATVVSNANARSNPILAEETPSRHVPGQADAQQQKAAELAGRILPANRRV